MSPIDESWPDEVKAAFHQGAKEALETPKLTMADIRRMSTKEVAERMPEVRAVLKRGESDDSDE